MLVYDRDLHTGIFSFDNPTPQQKRELSCQLELLNCIVTAHHRRFEAGSEAGRDGILLA